MGIRYDIPFSPLDTQDMPSAARSRVAALCRRYTETTDRGVVRNRNDNAVDSRAATFRNWLYETAGYCYQSILNIAAVHAAALVGAFIYDLSITKMANGKFRMADTLLHYVTASVSFLRAVMDDSQRGFSIHEHSGPPRCADDPAQPVSPERGNRRGQLLSVHAWWQCG